MRGKRENVEICTAMLSKANDDDQINYDYQNINVPRMECYTSDIRTELEPFMP